MLQVDFAGSSASYRGIEHVQFARKGAGVICYNYGFILGQAGLVEPVQGATVIVLEKSEPSKLQGGLAWKS